MKMGLLDPEIGYNSQTFVDDDAVLEEKAQQKHLLFDASAHEPFSTRMVAGRYLVIRRHPL